MIKVPQSLSNRYSFKIKKRQFHMVEYTATCESANNEVVISESAIVYIIKGRKEIIVNGVATIVNAGQLFMVPKGEYLMSEYLPENGRFESVMLFFNREQIADVLAGINVGLQIVDAVDSVSVVDSTPQLVRFFDSLADIECDSRNNFIKELIGVKIKELIYILLADSVTRNATISFLRKTLARQHITISKAVNSNIYNNISLSALAEMCNMSLSTFKREFEKKYHAPPMQWIMERRLERALNMVKSTDNAIVDIAYECGFENYVHFSRRFKAKYQLSPKMIRANL